jgi:hypothetical protein
LLVEIRIANSLPLMRYPKNRLYPKEGKNIGDHDKGELKGIEKQKGYAEKSRKQS